MLTFMLTLSSRLYPYCIPISRFHLYGTCYHWVIIRFTIVFGVLFLSINRQMQSVVSLIQNHTSIKLGDTSKEINEFAQDLSYMFY